MLGSYCLEHRLPQALKGDAMQRYQISFEITTDADPSTLLDAAVLAASTLAEDMESMYDEPAETDTQTVCVMEVSDG